MSGICGTYGKGDIEEMTRVLAHRGPDDMGYYLEGPLQLGVQRLAIFDIAGGHQPLGNEKQNVWIALDGDVFNHEEIRAQLEKDGHQFRSRTDTETVVHAWEQWGPACLDRFNGQFALALWDGQLLHLARDRMGEKPLYFYHRGSRLLFASEIKSLVTQVSAVPRLTDEFRDFEAPVAPDTLFQNIHELPAGHRAVFDGHTLNVMSWWEVPSFDGPYRSHDDYSEELRSLLMDAVAIRLKGEVPVGVFLSGGVDSAALACLSKPEHAFFVTFRDSGEAYDELDEARLVAERIGSKLHVIRPKYGELRNRLPRIVWHLDQPVGSVSSLATFMAAEAASKKVKAILSGQGADELFGGHVRYLMMLAEDRLGREPALQLYLPLARYFWNPAMFTDPIDRYYTLINRGPGHDPRCRARIARYMGRYRHLIDQMGFTDLMLMLPTVLAMDDRATAAYGIENRNPFLDHRIVEFAFRLPPELKAHNFLSKVILRQAMRGIVPDPILDRNEKMGLAVPVTRWLNNELKAWADVRTKRFRERIEGNFLNAAWDAAGPRGEFDRRRYTRVCLELWMELMIEGGAANWDESGFTAP